jgi:hypothetical protein
MLRRNLALALCSVGIMISTSIWMILLAHPAHATNCNGSCGPDTGACTGTSNFCANYADCNVATCTGTFTTYQNIVFQNTSTTRGVRTTSNPQCTATHTCGYSTLMNQVCSGAGGTCSPSVGPNCVKCTSTNIVFNSPTNCTYVGPCNEG